MCLKPSKPTWAGLPLREILFASLSQVFSLVRCLKDFVNQRLDHYIKCLPSFLITDFQVLLDPLQSALPLFALCKNSSMMILALLFAFAFLFAVDPPCSTTDDAWWTVKLCHLSLQALTGRHKNTPPREDFIISQILSEQIPNIWGTTMN